MGRGQYGYSHIGQAAASEPPAPPQLSQLPLEDVTRLSTPSDPWAIAPPREPSWSPPAKQPWTDEQKRDFQRQLGLSAIGSVAGAALWKDHRIWGFILGGMAGSGLARVIFAPTSPEDIPW